MNFISDSTIVSAAPIRPTMEAAADMGSMSRESWLGGQARPVTSKWTGKFSRCPESESEHDNNSDCGRSESQKDAYIAVTFAERT